MAGLGWPAPWARSGAPHRSCCGFAFLSGLSGLCASWLLVRSLVFYASLVSVFHCFRPWLPRPWRFLAAPPPDTSPLPLSSACPPGGCLFVISGPVCLGPRRFVTPPPPPLFFFLLPPLSPLFRCFWPWVPCRLVTTCPCPSLFSVQCGVVVRCCAVQCSLWCSAVLWCAVSSRPVAALCCVVLILLALPDLPPPRRLLQALLSGLLLLLALVSCSVLGCGAQLFCCAACPALCSCLRCFLPCGASLSRFRLLVLCVVACCFWVFVAAPGCPLLSCGGVLCYWCSCLAARPAALLFAVVCRGSLLPCAVSCGVVFPHGALLWCSAVFFALLLVFVCSLPCSDLIPTGTPAAEPCWSYLPSSVAAPRGLHRARERNPVPDSAIPYPVVGALRGGQSSSGGGTCTCCCSPDTPLLPCRGPLGPSVASGGCWQRWLWVILASWAGGPLFQHSRGPTQTRGEADFKHTCDCPRCMVHYETCIQSLMVQVQDLRTQNLELQRSQQQLSEAVAAAAGISQSYGDRMTQILCTVAKYDAVVQGYQQDSRTVAARVADHLQMSNSNTAKCFSAVETLATRYFTVASRIDACDQWYARTAEPPSLFPPPSSGAPSGSSGGGCVLFFSDHRSHNCIYDLKACPDSGWTRGGEEHHEHIHHQEPILWRGTAEKQKEPVKPDCRFRSRGCSGIGSNIAWQRRHNDCVD